MLCSISGQVPEEPVVSRINGCLYEKRLIEKFIAEHGKCPKTGEAMTKADLVAVVGGSALTNRTVGATSIPGLLQVLHSEWDSLMLEQFALRQQLGSAHQELSQALFQYDAGCRVIAKLIKERDDLKVELKRRTRASDKEEGTGKKDEEDQPALPPPILDELEAHEARLKAARKKREIPRGTVGLENLKSFAEIDRHDAHGSTCGVYCVASGIGIDSTTLFSGGGDGKAFAYDLSRRAISGTLIGHTGIIRRILAADDLVVTCSEDGTTRLWQCDSGGYRHVSVLRGHKGAVTDVALLPTRKHVLTTGVDGQLIFSDLPSALTIASARQPEACGQCCVAIHPDGPLAATGVGSNVLLWNVKMMEIEASLPQDGIVSSVAFAEDGFSMAVGTASGVVKIWDLRRMSEAPVTLQGEDTGARQTTIARVTFDRSAQYLAAAGPTVSVWSLKEKSLLTSFHSHLAPVTDVCWGPLGHWIASSSLDGQVKIYRKAT